MTILFNLQKLQQFDSLIQDDKITLTKILQSKNEPTGVVTLRQTVNELLEKTQKLKSVLKDEELELGSVSAKRDQTTQELYSGKIKNPKTLQDLELESQSLARRQSTLEDQMLETMTNLEHEQQLLAQQQSALQIENDAWSAKLATLEAEQYEIAIRLNDLLAKRQQLSESVPSTYLKDYDRLIKHKKGLAVCEVIYDICQGCRVTINNAVKRAIEHGEIARCPNCDRILFRQER
jgi:predicted  nucleic acid-binding Zn-ribbon protein